MAFGPVDVKDSIRGFFFPAFCNTSNNRGAAVTPAKIVGKFLGLDTSWAVGNDLVKTRAAWFWDGAKDGVAGSEGGRKKECSGYENDLHVGCVPVADH